MTDGQRADGSGLWSREADGEVTIGVGDVLCDELGVPVFVDLPPEGATVRAGSVCGELESDVAAVDVVAPCGGTVTAVNPELADRPELIAHDPYGAGWLLRLRPPLDDRQGE